MKGFTNIAIFIPHLACPHECAFCNQHIITGEMSAPSPAEIETVIKQRIPFLVKQKLKAEIAFFGGTFTALPTDLITAYLEIAAAYVKKYSETLIGIRCSTRPDTIDINILGLLKQYGVTAIELGAQSMDDSVLKMNLRGHTADDTKKSAILIKNSGFELGLQMMTGLYGDTTEKSLAACEEFISLKPNTVRIYPTVVMPGTRLAELYTGGIYKTFSFEETVELCARLYEKFTAAQIKVIRIGLDTSEEIEKKMLGGVYHPALGEICIGRFYYNKMLSFMKNSGAEKFIIYSDKRYFSKICGNNGENRKKLKNNGFEFRLKELFGSVPVIEVNGSGKEKTCFLNP